MCLFINKKESGFEQLNLKSSHTKLLFAGYITTIQEIAI